MLIIVTHRDEFDQASSQSWWIPKMLSNEELFIVLRRPINIDRDQTATAIGCLATSVIRQSDIIMGNLQEDNNTVYHL